MSWPWPYRNICDLFLICQNKMLTVAAQTVKPLWNQIMAVQISFFIHDFPVSLTLTITQVKCQCSRPSRRSPLGNCCPDVLSLVGVRRVCFTESHIDGVIFFYTCFIYSLYSWCKKWSVISRYTTRSFFKILTQSFLCTLTLSPLFW